MDVLRTALNLAAKAHKDQFRKATGVPYLTHLVRVQHLCCQGDRTSLVVQAVALLHDILEDCPDYDLEDLHKIFPHSEIPVLVGLLTEPSKALSWEVRKRQWTAQVTKDQRTALVAVCDKLDNTLSIMEDIESGIDIGSMLKRGILGTLQSNMYLVKHIPPQEPCSVLNQRILELIQVTKDLYVNHCQEEEYKDILMLKSGFLKTIMG